MLPLVMEPAWPQDMPMQVIRNQDQLVALLQVVTLGIVKGLRPPPPLRGLYDRDLSEAALAAAGAIADLQEQREPWNGVLPHEAAAPAAAGGREHRAAAPWEVLGAWLCCANLAATQQSLHKAAALHTTQRAQRAWNVCAATA